MASRTDQLHGITFTGLIPTLANRTGDFSADPLAMVLSGFHAVCNLS